jgi:hypothetical protein
MLLSPLPYTPDLYMLALAVSHGGICFEAFETFQKNSQRNRMLIRSPNGLQLLSVPICGKFRRHALIKEVKIAYHQTWHKQHCHALQTAYGNAPFFEYYADQVKSILLDKKEMLWDLNQALTFFCIKTILPDLPIFYSKEFRSPGSEITDLRQKRFPPESSQNYEKTMVDYQYLPNIQKHFSTGLSALDLIFYRGPEAGSILTRLATSIL